MWLWLVLCRLCARCAWHTRADKGGGAADRAAALLCLKSRSPNVFTQSKRVVQHPKGSNECAKLAGELQPGEALRPLWRQPAGCPGATARVHK